MALITFSTGDMDAPGFVEKLKQLVFPDIEPSNLVFPHARFIQNGLITAQTFVECLRNNNVNFYSKSNVLVGCNVASLAGPPRARIQAAYAFDPAKRCNRVHYNQGTVNAIVCYAESAGLCRTGDSKEVFHAILSGTQFCAQDVVVTESAFLCADRIFAKGASDKLFFAPMFPCNYKLAVHWEGIKYRYHDSDLISDDEDLLDLIAIWLTGERALRIDRDLELHKQLMRKPERYGDWGGTFWQKMSDMQHRCREERRLRPRHQCEALFDDNALVFEPGVTVDPDGIVPGDPTCGPNQYLLDGVCHDNPPCRPDQYLLDGVCMDCFTPTVSLTANTTVLYANQAVIVSWNSNVPDMESSVLTLEWNGNVIPLARNQSGSLAFTPEDDTTYTIRAVTICGTVTATVSITVHDDLPCECPEVPACLQVNWLESIVDCVDGDLSAAAAWDGQIEATTACRWLLPFGTASLNGKSVSARITLETCAPVRVYRLEILYSDGYYGDSVLWSGTAQNVPQGTYVRETGIGCAPGSLLVTVCGACEVFPVLTFDPPAGATVDFPTVVFIHCDDPEAMVFYTTDGTEPTNNSTHYTGAITLAAGQTLRAIGYSLAGCIGEIYDASYITLGGYFDFDFICDANDYAGEFFEFYPDGQSDDYHWRIIARRSPGWALKTMEVYETNASGVWVTGQAWATLDPAYPAELAPAPFHIFPVVIFKDGVQQNAAYSNNLALPFASDERVTLHCYGQPFIPLSGYFRLLFTITEAGEDIVIHKLIPHDCYYDPPCPAPDMLLGGRDCVQVLVNIYAGNGQPWVLHRRADGCGDSSEYSAIASGTGTGGLQQYMDAAVSAPCGYTYYVSVECPDGQVVSATDSVIAVPEPVSILSVGVEPAVGCPGDTVTVSFELSGSQAVVTVDGVEVAGAPDSGSVEVVLTSAPQDIEVCASNSCGEVCQTVTVEEGACPPPNTCIPGHFADSYTVSGFLDMPSGCAGGECSSPTTWDGVVVRTNPGQCQWHAVGMDGDVHGTPCYQMFAGGMPDGAMISCSVLLSGGVWVLELTSGDPLGVIQTWVGHKTTGGTPVGSYTRFSGCASLGALSVVDN